MRDCINGLQAMVGGALDAGCTFAAADGSDLAAALVRELPAVNDRTHDHHAVCAVIATDAADAVRQAVGIAETGGRAMAVTTGSGVAGGRERIGYAQIHEIPLVVIAFQTEVAWADGVVSMGDTDVRLLGNVSPTGCPVPVLAATDAAASRELCGEAFSMAQRLRTPVILYTSREIASGSPPVDFARLPVDSARVPVGSARPAAQGSSPTEHGAKSSRDFGEPDNTTSGVACPRSRGHGATPQKPMATRAWPCHSTDPPSLGAPDTTTAPGGNVCGLVERALAGLLTKLADARDMIELVDADPDPRADVLVVSYGRCDRAAREAVADLRHGGKRVAHLTIYSLWPVPVAAIRRAVTPRIRRVIVPELNVGLYVGEIRKVVSPIPVESTLRYDGGPIHPQRIAQQVLRSPCG